MVLAGAFAVATSLLLGAANLKGTVIRFVAITLAAILVARGVRWARILLLVLAGLVAAYAAILGVVRPMPLGWRAVFLVYGLGTVWSLMGLFRHPAAAHFQPQASGEGGA